MTSPLLRIAADKGLRILTLARPEAGNGLNPQLCAELKAAVAMIASDPGVRAVLLQAEGRNFCVGGDLGAFEAAGSRRPALIAELAADLHAAQELLLNIDAPVVAAVDGAAAGAGFSLAMTADMVIASDRATFTMAYTAIGLSPDGGATYWLPRLVGLRRAQDLIFNNRRLSAPEALDWGLITSVAPSSSLAAEARSVAERVAAGPLLAFGAAKRLLRETFVLPFGVQAASEATAITDLAGRSDAAEGLSAFRDRRRPQFQDAR